MTTFNAEIDGVNVTGFRPRILSVYSMMCVSSSPSWIDMSVPIPAGAVVIGLSVSANPTSGGTMTDSNGDKVGVYLTNNIDVFLNILEPPDDRKEEGAEQRSVHVKLCAQEGYNSYNSYNTTPEMIRDPETSANYPLLIQTGALSMRYNTDPNDVYLVPINWIGVVSVDSLYLERAMGEGSGFPAKYTVKRPDTTFSGQSFEALMTEG